MNQLSHTFGPITASNTTFNTIIISDPIPTLTFLDTTTGDDDWTIYTSGSNFVIKEEADVRLRYATGSWYIPDNLAVSGNITYDILRTKDASTATEACYWNLEVTSTYSLYGFSELTLDNYSFNNFAKIPYIAFHNYDDYIASSATTQRALIYPIQLLQRTHISSAYIDSLSINTINVSGIIPDAYSSPNYVVSASNFTKFQFDVNKQLKNTTSSYCINVHITETNGTATYPFYIDTSITGNANVNIRRLRANDILYPLTDGSTGQAVITDGAGTLSFGSVTTTTANLAQVVGKGNYTSGDIYVTGSINVSADVTATNIYFQEAYDKYLQGFYKYNNSLDLSGNSRDVTSPGDLTAYISNYSTLNTFSFSSYFRMIDTASSGNTRVLSFTDTTGTAQTFLIGGNNSLSLINYLYIIGRSTSNYTYKWRSPTVLNDNLEHHISSSFSSAGVTVFIDGVETNGFFEATCNAYVTATITQLMLSNITAGQTVYWEWLVVGLGRTVNIYSSSAGGTANLLCSGSAQRNNPMTLTAVNNSGVNGSCYVSNSSVVCNVSAGQTISFNYGQKGTAFYPSLISGLTTANYGDTYCLVDETKLYNRSLYNFELKRERVFRPTYTQIDNVDRIGFSGLANSASYLYIPAAVKQSTAVNKFRGALYYRANDSTITPDVAVDLQINNYGTSLLQLLRSYIIGQAHNDNSVFAADFAHQVSSGTAAVSCLRVQAMKPAGGTQEEYAIWDLNGDIMVSPANYGFVTGFNKNKIYNDGTDLVIDTAYKAGSGLLKLSNTINWATAASFANAGTLTNCPTAGNPTEWLKIKDSAGNTKYIPVWG